MDPAAMAALQREIAHVAPRMTSKPRIMYLYDKNAVDPAVIEKTLASTAPQLKTSPSSRSSRPTA